MDCLSDSSESLRNVSSIPLVKSRSSSKTTQTDGVNYVYCVDSDIGNKKCHFNGISEAWKSQYLPMYPMYNNPLVSPISLCHLQSFTTRSLCHFPLPWYPLQTFGPYMPLNVSPPLVQFPMVMSAPPTSSGPCPASSYQCVNKTKSYHVNPDKSLSNVSMASLSDKKDFETSSTHNINKKPLKYYRFIDDEQNELKSRSKSVIKRLQQKYLKNNSTIDNNITNCENLRCTYLSDSSICMNLSPRKTSESSNPVTRSSDHVNDSTTYLDNHHAVQKRQSKFATSSNSSDFRNCDKISSSSSINNITPNKSGSEIDVNNRSVIKRYISKGLSKTVCSDSKNRDVNIEETKEHDLDITSKCVQKLASLLCDLDSNDNLEYDNSEFYNSVIRKTIDEALNRHKFVQKGTVNDDVQKPKKIKLSRSSDHTIPDSDGSHKSSNVNLLESSSNSNNCITKSNSFDNISKDRSSTTQESNFTKTVGLMESKSKTNSRFSRTIDESVEMIDSLAENNFDNRSKYKISIDTEKPLAKSDTNLMECDYRKELKCRSPNILEKSNRKVFTIRDCDNNYVSANRYQNNSCNSTDYSEQNNSDKLINRDQHCSNRINTSLLSSQYENSSKNYKNSSKRLSSDNFNEKDFDFNDSGLCKSPHKTADHVQRISSSCSNIVTNSLCENFNNNKVINSSNNLYRVDGKKYCSQIVQNSKKIKTDEVLENNDLNLDHNKKETNKQMEKQELLNINTALIKDTGENKTTKKKFENITAHFILPTVGKNEINRTPNDSNLSNSNNENDKNFMKFSFSVNYDPTNPEMIVVDCEQDGKNLSESTINNNDSTDPCPLSFKTIDETPITENTMVDDDNDYSFNETNDLSNNNIYGNYWQTDDIPNSVSNNLSNVMPKRRTRYSQYSLLNNIETLSIISEEDEGSYTTNTTTVTSNTESVETYVVNQNCTGDVKIFKSTQQVKIDNDYCP